MTVLLRAALVATTLAATAMSAGAQSSKGVFLGIQYAGSSLDVKSAAENLDFGGGFGLHAGIGFNNTFSVIANFDRSVLTGSSSNTNVTLSQYDALLRVNVLPGGSSPLRLFVTGGATARSANAGRDFEEIVPTAGAGAQLFIGSALAVNGTALWTFGKLTQAGQLSNSTPGQYESTQTRIQAGVSLYLFGR
jgi:hypothetical protein